MSLLANLTKLHKGDTVDELPPHVISEIQKKVRSGAADTDKEWDSALQLVDQSYEVSGVAIPTSGQTDQWKQYEGVIQYAVTQLAKQRGTAGDWRMTSVSIQEAEKPVFIFEVVSNMSDTWRVRARDIGEVVESIERGCNGTEILETHTTQSTDGETTTITFSAWGVYKNYQVVVTQKT